MFEKESEVSSELLYFVNDPCSLYLLLFHGCASSKNIGLPDTPLFYLSGIQAFSVKTFSSFFFFFNMENVGRINIKD